MKKISWKMMKIRYVEVTLLVLYLYIWLAGEPVEIEKTGENYFHIQVNGQDVGVLGEVDRAEELLVEARKQVAKESDELVFMEAELTYSGEEVLWGEVDSEEKVIAAMKEVLTASVKETMQKAYTVKVNEFVINLGSIDEVTALLQAAVDKYDAENKFGIQLQQDYDREFSVLTANVVRKEDSEQEDETIYPEAGIQARITEVIEAVEPDVEKDFADYELGILEMDFPQEVEIVEAYLPQSRLTGLEEAIELVTKEQETVTTYEVVSGDTLSEIAIKVNIPMDQIIAMNSETLENENSTIRVGDELIITVPEPELSVRRTEESYIEEIYDADIIYVDNDSWYTTQTKVLQQPSAGFRKIIAISTYENDKLVSREIVKEEVVMEAVPKIVERGTKIPPTYIKPVSGGRLSSGFGKRTSPTKGAGTYHKGVDWAVPTGTAVYASCGGTVAKAGWGSGYGYVVYINHEDGRQTRYAHLSKILVKVGQTVKQGEKIALSGNTGVSSGPHVHFEILIGGKQVNPLSYLQ